MNTKSLFNQATSAIQAGYQYLSCRRSDGLHSSIALDEQFQNALSLNAIAAHKFSDNIWSQEVIPALENKLGCDLATENFTEMLALKFLPSSIFPKANADIAKLRRLWTHHVRTQGLLNEKCWRFLFFNTKNFAADTDCTGVALTGLYDAQEINDDQLIEGVRELLSSAAVNNLSANANQIANKKNQGSLSKGVFKTYFEDQKFVNYQKNGSLEPQSGAAFRGCKHDPAVVANAMMPILQALQTKKLQLDEIIQLDEYAPPQSSQDWRASKPHNRVNRVTVREIMAANWEYIANHLPQAENGTRYYPYMETFLCFLSELFLAFPKETTAAINHQLFKTKIVDALKSPLPTNPVRLAQIIIAADNYNASTAIGNRIPLEVIENAKALLLKSIKSDGSWPVAPFYTLGTDRKIYFGSAAISTIFAIRALDGPPVGRLFRNEAVAVEPHFSNRKVAIPITMSERQNVIVHCPTYSSHLDAIGDVPVERLYKIN
jgi:hypothetical protein